MTTLSGLDIKRLENANLDTHTNDNYTFLNRNLVNQAKEFITAIWDCILVIKMAHKRGEKSILIDLFNDYFAHLTQIKTGSALNYNVVTMPLDMICELVLFMQTYITDYLIFLIKSQASISNNKELKSANKLFVNVLKKSSKIALRNQMFEQIKSKNYPLLLKLLIDQKNAQTI